MFLSTHTQNKPYYSAGSQRYNISKTNTYTGNQNIQNKVPAKYTEKDIKEEQNRFLNLKYVMFI